MKKKMQFLLSITVIILVTVGLFIFSFISYKYITNELQHQIVKDNKVIGKQILSLLSNYEFSSLPKKKKINILNGICNKIKIPNGGFVCAVDNNNTIIAAPNNKANGKMNFRKSIFNKLNSKDKISFSDISSSKSANGILQHHGRTDIIASMPIENSNIKLLIHQNEEIVKNNVNKLIFPLIISGIISIIIIGIVTFIFSDRIIKKYESKLEIEKDRSEKLLLNILPKAIAEKLKTKNEIIAEKYNEVSVLFSDIVGFTKYSYNADPKDVVELLNDIFSGFDKLSEKHNVEKIKTIGDGYMAVCGLPVENKEHYLSIVNLAIDMLEFIEKLRKRRNIDINIRIGIHSGPVIAGVIGKKKFSYDMWGDTVNIASRMESSGISGSIHISSDFYNLLKNENYNILLRDEINIKGIGMMKTFILKNKKNEE